MPPMAGQDTPSHTPPTMTGGGASEGALLSPAVSHGGDFSFFFPPPLSYCEPFILHPHPSFSDVFHHQMEQVVPGQHVPLSTLHTTLLQL